MTPPAYLDRRHARSAKRAGRLSPWPVSCLGRHRLLTFRASCFSSRPRSSTNIWPESRLWLPARRALAVGRNGLYFSVSLLPGQDYTASGFAATGLFLLWGIYRRGLFHLIPVVHEAVISSMEDGLIVLGHRPPGHQLQSGRDRAAEDGRSPAALWPRTNISDSAERTFSPAGLNWPPACRARPRRDRNHPRRGSGPARLRPSPLAHPRPARAADQLLALLHDITRLKRTEENLHQRDRLLGGIARIANELVAQTELDRALVGVLGIFGEMMDADRVYIFRNSRDVKTDQLLMHSSLRVDRSRGVQTDRQSRTPKSLLRRRPRHLRAAEPGPAVFGNRRASGPPVAELPRGPGHPIDRARSDFLRPRILGLHRLR